jgi:site-specific DNA recombinase
MNQEIQKNAIIYCRVSSADQLQGTSLDSQERLAAEYASRQNLQVLKVFVERGESAKTANRTEFNKALAFCADKKNKVSFFVVYKIDRFARNQDDHVSVRAFLKRSGVELRSVSEPIDETPIGRAMEGVLSVFAEFDNNVRTERTKGGMLERVKQGIWVWPNPLGYYRPHKGSNIMPEPSTAPLVRLGFEEYAKGTYTYESLAQFLADRGLKTRSGKRPYNQLIEKILKNPVYCGCINIWGEHEGKFEPIISKELFYKCQEGYKESSHLAPRYANNPLFPLRGSICTLCQSSITGSQSTGRHGQKYSYYHHINYRCEKAQWMPKETFEQLFVEFLVDITPSGKYEKLFKAVVLDIWQSNYKKLDEQNARIRGELALLETERQKVFDFHRSGRYSDYEFLEQKNKINQSINQKHLLIQESRVEEFDMEAALDYCFGYVRATAKTWLEADYPARLRFQKLVCKEKINFDGQKFGTAKLSQVYKINQESQGKKSKVVALPGIGPGFSG